MKPLILHLSADYPDHFAASKTKAISGLVKGTADQFDHLVVSLNRQGGLNGFFSPGRMLDERWTGAQLAIRYAAPPAVVALVPAMARLREYLVDQLERQQLRPALIQAHKLTVEGVLAQQLSRRMNIPYVLTLQGNTDQKLTRQRPDRGTMLRTIWHEAQAAMTFAPWTADWANDQFGPRRRPVAIIPCLLSNDQILPPSPVSLVIRTAFNLDFWRNKNLSLLLSAVGKLQVAFPGLILEIAGGGSPQAIAAIQEQIARSGLAGRARLVGTVVPEQIQAWLNASTVFALPSRRESYGMVFPEALLSGTPVIYPRGAAIDGFFSGSTFARAVNASSPDAVAAALECILRDPAAAKADLAQAQTTGALEHFRRSSILRSYSAFLAAALN